MNDKTIDEPPTAFTFPTETRNESARQKRVCLGSYVNEDLNICMSQNTENHEFERRTHVEISYKNKLVDAINPMGLEAKGEGQIEDDGIVSDDDVLEMFLMEIRKLVNTKTNGNDKQPVKEVSRDNIGVNRAACSRFEVLGGDDDNIRTRPHVHFVKVNVDGSARGRPNQAAAGSVSRDDGGSQTNCFTFRVGISS
ncbi:Hypothetical predicted protein [Olea europaea subsp. europaea]|uniref:Uncharacterized protein n=1 Tax=Olea europaea subsp. europaea TaxID=158383 RepID=A0A8S0RXU0_OLEEU|nr:Hypothetical predicted protein [Olea europaea subsp. europaea]